MRARRSISRPPGREARQAIEAIWADLTGGARAHVRRIAVNGREVEIPRFANGVGRASFWELCAKPLGPADFLAIASAVRVLILEDVPQLSASNYNEAKRFVTLIDALYEAKVRLICSAADVPERLYIEGDRVVRIRTDSQPAARDAVGGLGQTPLKGAAWLHHFCMGIKDVRDQKGTST